jgi:hypothetical protein
VDSDILARLDGLADWMRARGATRLKVDGVELELSPELTAAPPRKALTDEEKRKAAHEARRQRYKLELGYEPSDEFMARLP